MNPNLRNPNDPIENLAIGTVIEVDGTHIVAELNPNLSELSRVYGGEVYPIGQYGVTTQAGTKDCPRKAS